MRRRNTKPVNQHEREPNAPLPLPGCHCDRCENAKDDAHGAKVGSLLGMEPEPELSADAASEALQDAYEKLMRRVG